MSGATYEFWLMDDAGRRLFLLDKPANFSYSRSALYLSTLQIGFTFKEWAAKVNPFFTPDLRIDIWRSPADGYPLKREDTYMLRKPEVYTRADGVQMIMLRGRDGMDLLNRRVVIQYEDTTYTKKTDYLDDIMKQIVRDQMLYDNCRDYAGVIDNDRAYPYGEFTVDQDHSFGPSITHAFAGRRVLDILRELNELSFSMHADDTTNRKIYFGVVPVDLSGSINSLQEPAAKTGYQFRTYPDLRGIDRTKGVEFSVENGNIDTPMYIESHLDEVNAVIVMGQGTNEARAVQEIENLTLIGKSRWNRCEDVRTATFETDASGLTSAGMVALGEGRPVISLDCAFLNSPGSRNTPRSLYGIDWDLGDLLPVSYAGKQFQIEVINIYVSVDENGVETISGRTAQDAE